MRWQQTAQKGQARASCINGQGPHADCPDLSWCRNLGPRSMSEYLSFTPSSCLLFLPALNPKHHMHFQGWSPSHSDGRIRDWGCPTDCTLQDLLFWVDAWPVCWSLFCISNAAWTGLGYPVVLWDPAQDPHFSHSTGIKSAPQGVRQY